MLYIGRQTNMPFKKIYLFICCFFYLTNCFAQETIEKKNRLTANVTETYQVLKNNESVKNGPYQAIYKRKTPVAMGVFTNGKKTGQWRFYDPQGKLMQIYNYTSDSLKY